MCHPAEQQFNVFWRPSCWLAAGCCTSTELPADKLIKSAADLGQRRLPAGTVMNYWPGNEAVVAVAKGPVMAVAAL